MNVETEMQCYRTHWYRAKQISNVYVNVEVRNIHFLPSHSNLSRAFLLHYFIFKFERYIGQPSFDGGLRNLGKYPSVLK